MESAWFLVSTSSRFLPSSAAFFSASLTMRLTSCVQGRDCSVLLHAKALTENDRIMLVEGQHCNEGQAPRGLENRNVLAPSSITTSAALGEDTATFTFVGEALGEIHVCFCAGLDFIPCDRPERFQQLLGSLSMVGVIADMRPVDSLPTTPLFAPVDSLPTT